MNPVTTIQFENEKVRTIESKGFSQLIHEYHILCAGEGSKLKISGPA